MVGKYGIYGDPSADLLCVDEKGIAGLASFLHTHLSCALLTLLLG